MPIFDFLKKKKKPIPKLELIEYTKEFLKKRGYKKKNNRWTKIDGDFTLCFFIEGSSYDKELYYLRPGIFINDENLKHIEMYYGHFMTELVNKTSYENLFKEYDEFINNWTNKKLVKKIILNFIEWEHRNPVEKRRMGLVDYKKDPVPSEICFSIHKDIINYIVENW